MADTCTKPLATEREMMVHALQFAIDAIDNLERPIPMSLAASRVFAAAVLHKAGEPLQRPVIRMINR